MKRIFRFFFYRAESELMREAVGIGIRLSLAAELVEQMGGPIDVVNRSPGAKFPVRMRWA